MANPEVDKGIFKYANRLRNPNKRDYAIAYYNYRTGLTNIKPSYHGKSLMACQAVEREADNIISKM